MPREPFDIPEATLRLILAPGVGPATIRKLRARFGEDDAIAGAAVRDLQQVEGIGTKTAAAIRTAIDGAEVEAERETMARAGARMIMLGDDDYWPLLAAIPDPPSALWIRGSTDAAADRFALAIVGARRCTAYGREQAGRFGALLGQSGLTIVSGGAAGIDGEAHRGALRIGARTIAVMGCGLARSYPREHKDLFERIVGDGGALLSEHPMGTEPRAELFPARNRIISGLSLGVLVIEAGHRSGALITARLATEEHGREVMALPGRVDSPASAGCLRALREGWASLVTNHTEVIEQLDAARHLLRGALEQQGRLVDGDGPSLLEVNLTDDQKAIVEVLREVKDPLLIDQLAARTQLPMSRLMADLTMLQIRGAVARDQRGVRLRGAKTP